jgi:Spy/CpxP family protein refolding chaperone
MVSLIPSVPINSQGQDINTQTKTTTAQKTGVPSKDLEIHEIVETLRETYLLQELQLSEEKAQALIAKMRYSRELKKGYLLQQYAIENELETLLGLATPAPDKINTALQKLETAKLQYFQQMMEANAELQNMLTPEEQAKYVIFQRNFHRTLRKLITSIRQQSTKAAIQNNQILRRKDSESVIRQPR